MEICVDPSLIVPWNDTARATFIGSRKHKSDTYDHILLNTRDPVRSPIYKQQRAELVLGSVTTWESSVLYVFFFLPVEAF